MFFFYFTATPERSRVSKDCSGVRAFGGGRGAACVIQGSRASVRAALKLNGFGAHVREQGDLFPLGRLAVKHHLLPTILIDNHTFARRIMGLMHPKGFDSNTCLKHSSQTATEATTVVRPSSDCSYDTTRRLLRPFVRNRLRSVGFFRPEGIYVLSCVQRVHCEMFARYSHPCPRNYLFNDAQGPSSRLGIMLIRCNFDTMRYTTSPHLQTGLAENTQSLSG